MSILACMVVVKHNKGGEIFLCYKCLWIRDLNKSELLSRLNIDNFEIFDTKICIPKTEV